MRRNLTISFDADYIEWMDADRGGMSRGVWIEGRTRPGGRDAPVPKAERSPEPKPEPEKPREAKAERLEVGRRVLGGMVSQPRPIIQKRGG